MKPIRLLPLYMALSTALAWPVQAQDLVQLYESARGFDAAYQSAKSQFEASLARADQARAAILPTVGLSAGISRSHLDSDSGPARNFGTQSATLSASQPLYRPVNRAIYAQGKKQVDSANAQLAAFEQELILRISQAYFDVLASKDNQVFLNTQKAAVAEQLASAKRAFEVGTATITDTREAQARHDLVLAQEIAADNELRVRRIILDQLTGLVNAQPNPLVAPVTLPALLQPADADAWVTQAQEVHPGIRQARAALEIAELETQKAKAGHLPTLDLTGSYNVANNSGSASPLVPADSRSNTATVGLAFNLPLFTGYAIQNRLKEAMALEDKARSDLEGVRRNVAQATRTAFFGVLSGLGQVKALEAAQASSQSALDANKLGYEVGVRINIDVLNAQSQLFDTQARLAKARYDVLLGDLRLRQANGTLKPQDLLAINALLAQ